jgi:hypothetical protein
LSYINLYLKGVQFMVQFSLSSYHDLFLIRFGPTSDDSLQAEGPRFEPVCSHTVPERVSRDWDPFLFLAFAYIQHTTEK